MTFEGRRVDLRRFERRPGELLLAEDLLARHLINLVRGRLIIANEIEIAQIDGRWEVVGVDPGRRSVPAPRARARRSASASKADAIVDFASIEPFVSHVPTARLRIPYRKLAKLHPAQIADLVEQASHEEGEEIIEAVGLDRELEADVFEELDTTHQLEFLEGRAATSRPRGCSRAWSPTTPPTSSTRSTRSAACRSSSSLPAEPAGQGPQPALLQRRHRRGADEPRLRLGARDGHGRRRPRGDPHLERARRVAATPSSSSTRAGTPSARRPIAPLVRARDGELALSVARTQLDPRAPALGPAPRRAQDERLQPDRAAGARRGPRQDDRRRHGRRPARRAAAPGLAPRVRHERRSRNDAPGARVTF